MSKVLPDANQESRIPSGFGNKIFLFFINEEFFENRAYNNQIRVICTVLTCIPLSFLFLVGALVNMRQSLLSSVASLIGLIYCTNLLLQMRFNSFLRVPQTDLARRLVKTGNTIVACFIFPVLTKNFETGMVSNYHCMYIQPLGTFVVPKIASVNRSHWSSGTTLSSCSNTSRRSPNRISSFGDSLGCCDGSCSNHYWRAMENAISMGKAIRWNQRQRS